MPTRQLAMYTLMLVGVICGPTFASDVKRLGERTARVERTLSIIDTPYDGDQSRVREYGLCQRLASDRDRLIYGSLTKRLYGPLTKRLAAPQPDTRRDAALILGDIVDSQWHGRVSPLLVKGLGHEDAAVRAASFRGLVRMGEKRSLGILMEMTRFPGAVGMSDRRRDLLLCHLTGIDQPPQSWTDWWATNHKADDSPPKEWADNLASMRATWGRSPGSKRELPDKGPARTQDAHELLYFTGRDPRGYPRGYSLYSIDPDCGIKSLLVESTSIYVWISPDQKQIAFRRGSGSKWELWASDIAGKNVRQLTKLGLYSHFTAWSPDSKKILFWTGPNTGYWELRTVDIATLDIQTIMPGMKGRWISSRVIEGTNGGKTFTYDVTLGKRVELYEDCHSHFSPDGKTLAFLSKRGGGLGVYLMNKKTEKVTPVRETGCRYSLAWSPDGKTLAYVMNRGIYLVDADGTNRRLLTSGKVYEYAPTWSPDGKLLAYAAPQPFANVHVINVETGEDRQLTNAKRYESPGAWSQCGKFIKTSYNLFGKHRFEVLDLDGKKAEATLASELKWQPAVGSSGKHRFYHVDGAYTIENPAKDADAAPTPHQRPEEKASLTVKSMGKGASLPCI